MIVFLACNNSENIKKCPQNTKNNTFDQQTSQTTKTQIF